MKWNGEQKMYIKFLGEWNESYLRLSPNLLHLSLEY